MRFRLTMIAAFAFEASLFALPRRRAPPSPRCGARELRSDEVMPGASAIVANCGCALHLK